MKKLITLIAALLLVAPVFSQEKDSLKMVTSFYLSSSTLNNNQTLSTLCGVDNINSYNLGFGYQIGMLTPNGFEYVWDFAGELWNNEQNNNQLASASTLMSFNVGYKLISFGKKAKYSIVPKVGIGWNTNVLHFSSALNQDLYLHELNSHSWAVHQNANFYIPIGLEFRRNSLIIGAEYRYTFHYGNTYTFNGFNYWFDTDQKIIGFPKFASNRLMFKIGFRFDYQPNNHKKNESHQE